MPDEEVLMDLFILIGIVVVIAMLVWSFRR
jgi:hypothetical protein